MGLAHQDGGFGTPEFGGKVLKVIGDQLVVSDESGSDSHTLSTVRTAIEFLGHEYEEEWFGDFRDPLDPLHPDDDLQIDPESTRVLGEWFGFAWLLLGELRKHGADDDDITQVQIWPEHFDAAIEMGSLEAGRRASYGASPGDEAHPKPYVYVSSWGKIDRSNPYWNDHAFNGSSMSYEELSATEDPIRAGLAFLLEGYRILHDA